MASPVRYVHIGFPKCASSSLQNFYFAVHPQCLHMGLGFESKGNKYINDDVERVSETDLRLKKEFLWSADEAQGLLRDVFDEAQRDGYKAVGLSNEFLSFALGNEVDTADKARRLRGLLGDGARAIIVVREQYSFLKSLYLELLKGGYAGTYRNFLEYTYLYQVRSWCIDICYHHIYRLYCDLFGEKNVHLCVFEDLKADPAQFLSDMSTFLGLSNSVTEMRAVNQQAESMEWYEQLRRYNERLPREFGGKLFEPFNMNRMRSYFHNELGIAVPHDRLADDMLRMPISQLARQVIKISNVSPLDMSFPESLRERFDALFSESNAEMSKMLGRNLGDVGYVMPKQAKLRAAN